MPEVVAELYNSLLHADRKNLRKGPTRNHLAHAIAAFEVETIGGHRGRLLFHRIPRTSTEGTGVGLAIVRKVITLHKGEIRAHGIPNQGSTFEILLPV